MDAGNLVPDDVVIGLIEETLRSEEARKNFILDGFPRTIPQAAALDELFKKLNIALDHVVSMDVDNDEIVRRLSQRLLCRGCGRIYILSLLKEGERTCTNCGGEIYQRDDDKPEAVRRRLEVYQQQTRPLIEYYKKSGLLAPVDGMFEIGYVHKLILDQLYNGKTQA
jgi:adenylate kinase